MTSCLEGRFTQRVKLHVSRLEAVRDASWVTADDRGLPRVLARTWHGNSQCLPRQFKAGVAYNCSSRAVLGDVPVTGYFLMGKCVSRLRNCIVTGQKHTASLETCELLSNVLALAIRLPILILGSFPDTFIGVLRLILPM